MCGLVGVYGSGGGTVARELLYAMGGELVHRGPDGTGAYFDGAFGMLSTRLSIVDIEGGDQPLPNETARYWVMQNGEIFNHPELRTELESRGHRFATHCDTEVLVHAFEEWGAHCLDHLNGEFAFAIWDRETETLFLARDRFGIRPLFLLEAGRTLCFASEAKALLRHPLARRELDPTSLVESFMFWASSPARSAFAGIRELAPGHYLRVGPDGVREEHCWWQLRFAAGNERSWTRGDEEAEELRSLLDDATRIRLRADVAVGSYLSGGLDSSAVTALAQRHTPHPVRAFAIAFEDRAFDESPYQDRVASALGTELTRVVISANEIAALMPRVVVLSEKPTLRTAPAPLLKLSETVRASGYKVVLTGEGADEMFAGYDVFKLDKVRRFWARRPDSRCRPLLLRRLYPYLAQDLGRTGALLQNTFRGSLSDTSDPLYSHRIRFDHAARALNLFLPATRDRASGTDALHNELLARLPADFPTFTPLGRAQSLEIATFMCGYLLHSQGDRMLMGNSIEGRFPFLDYRVAEFAAQLPDGLKLPGLREKHLLREAVRALLPAEVVRREKQPYRAPILRAFVGAGAPAYVAELLEPARLAEAGIFSPPAIQRLLQKCQRNEAVGVTESDEMALVGVLSVMLLHEHMVARPSLAAPVKPNRLVVGARVQFTAGPSRAQRREIERASTPV